MIKWGNRATFARGSSKSIIDLTFMTENILCGYQISGGLGKKLSVITNISFRLGGRIKKYSSNMRDKIETWTTGNAKIKWAVKKTLWSIRGNYSCKLSRSTTVSAALDGRNIICHLNTVSLIRKSNFSCIFFNFHLCMPLWLHQSLANNLQPHQTFDNLTSNLIW